MSEQQNQQVISFSFWMAIWNWNQRLSKKLLDYSITITDTNYSTDKDLLENDRNENIDSAESNLYEITPQEQEEDFPDGTVSMQHQKVGEATKIFSPISEVEVDCQLTDGVLVDKDSTGGDDWTPECEGD